MIFCLTALQAKRLYVKAGVQGNGSSWEQAFSHPQEALAIAVAGDEIWIAAGSYAPGVDRNAAFIIPSGVRVYGGFHGTEKSFEERNWQVNQTIFSGDLGQPGEMSDNSHTIVYFQHADQNTLLDGIVIANGSANGYADGADLTVAGAGIFNNGENGESSPVISNCIFINNYAREGAAIYNYANQGRCQPRITNCQFIGNKADFNGGAIFNNGDYGVCNPVIEACRFERNQSHYGAGILNQGSYGECRPMVKDCLFYGNFSIARGPAMYNSQEQRGICDAISIGNRFEDNDAIVGEDVGNTHQPSVRNVGY